MGERIWALSRNRAAPPRCTRPGPPPPGPGRSAQPRGGGRRGRHAVAMGFCGAKKTPRAGGRRAGPTACAKFCFVLCARHCKAAAARSPAPPLSGPPWAGCGAGARLGLRAGPARPVGPGGPVQPVQRRRRLLAVCVCVCECVREAPKVPSDPNTMRRPGRCGRRTRRAHGAAAWGPARSGGSSSLNGRRCVVAVRAAWRCAALPLRVGLGQGAAGRCGASRGVVDSALSEGVGQIFPSGRGHSPRRPRVPPVLYTLLRPPRHSAASTRRGPSG